jgi:hypothetical protein
MGGAGRLTVAIVLSGTARLEFDKGNKALGTGEAWVLPATMPESTVYPDPEAEILISSLP